MYQTKLSPHGLICMYEISLDKEAYDSVDQPRREFLKLSTLAALALCIPKKSEAVFKKLQNSAELMQMSPIQLLNASDFNSLDFNGDNINRPHDILWDLSGYISKKGGLPKPSEKRKVVVVGGGMSGLLSAYNLIDLNPLILEQDKNFGGNSKGESYQNATFSIGAAYITIPDEGSDIDNFLKETSLHNQLKHETSEATKFTFQNKYMKDFWKGVTDPSRANEFVSVDNELSRIYNEAYPDIPWTNESAISKEEYLYLDSITFEQWLKLKFGNVHPHILEYFQLYCWSSFNGSIEELSALQVLNFVASEVEGVLALPGGNASITQRMFDILNEQTSPRSLRAEAFVLKVQKVSNGCVWVTYEDASGKLITVETDSCIVASPKFVAKLIVDNIPAQQLKLMGDLSYRGYIVGNAIFNKPFTSPSFDVYCFKGEQPEMPSAMNTGNRAFSDVCFGTWAQNDNASNGVLTVYKALPYDGGRQFLFSPMAHEKHRKIITDELKKFTASVGLNFADIKGMRMTRWGHSLPVASKGLIQSGFLSKMTQPVDGKIFFANQDNWANPAFECAFAAAKEASIYVRNLV